MSAIPQQRESKIAGVISIHFFVFLAGDLAPVLNSEVAVIAGCPQGES